MLNDVYVKLQTVVENIVSLTTYESAEEIEKAVKSARYKEDQWIGGIFDAIVSLREVPAADVEPVVRCKDCKHRDPEDLRCDCGGLERAGCIFSVSDNYFCAHGERKEADNV